MKVTQKLSKIFFSEFKSLPQDTSVHITDFRYSRFLQKSKSHLSSYMSMRQADQMIEEFINKNITVER